MRNTIRRSLRTKLMFVMLVTTFTALLVAALGLVVYEARTYERSLADDLATQADILGRSSAAALQFDDPRAAQETLALLKVRPQILSAAIYTAAGRLFAVYVRDGASAGEWPALPGADGHRVAGDQMQLFHRIVEHNQILGTVYLRASYGLAARLTDYLAIIVAVMLGSLLVALLMSAWLQAAITRPILAVTEVAHAVRERRDFDLRVKRTTDDEIGELVDVFNEMLTEVGRRAQALEASNRSLQHEMAERRGAEEALRVADRRKDEFLATLAHELRNPLAPMRNALRILDIAGDDPEATTRSRAMMERQLAQMVRLVDDLLDVSRISTGKLALRLERVDLAVIVRNAVDTVRPILDMRGHALQVRLPESALYVEADATRLAQVFANLLNNAAKYTEPGGRIALVAARRDGVIEVRVADNGVGIASDMLESIFEMFAQADRSLERAQAGLGVGLTLARRLTELHGGTIEARSGGLGRGSEFLVRLPEAAPPPVQAPADEHEGAAGGASGLRILVADDNVDFATSFALILRMLGNDVRVVHDGAAALEEAARFAPQFCFLDIGLPKVNGYDLARRLRAHPATARATMIAVTGWGQDKDRQLARDAGFDHHMVKPVEPDRIEALLRNGRRPA